MKRILVLASLLGFALVISACQTNNFVGSGPLHLSESSAEVAESYLGFNGWYSHYAVTPDGRNYLLFKCSDALVTECHGNPKPLIRQCNKIYNTDGCKLLFAGKKLVWNNPGNFMPYESDTIKDKLGQSFYKKPEYAGSVDNQGNSFIFSNSYVYGDKVIQINWLPHKQSVLATLKFHTPNHSGSIEILETEIGIACDGSFTYTVSGNGVWDLTCKNGLLASGKLKYDKPLSTFFATGEDSQNNSINFEIDTRFSTRQL